LHAGGLPLLPPKGALDRLDLAYFAAFVAGLLVHMLTRFGRFHFLVAPIGPVPLRKIMTINAIALVLITFLPLRIGEVARPAMLRKKGHVSAWAVTGTVGAERVLDGVLFSIIMLVGLALAHPHEPLPSHIGTLPIPASLVTQAAKLASLVFGVAFAIMAGFYWRRALAVRVTRRILGLVSMRLAERVAEIVGRLSDGIKFLVDPRYSLPYFAITVVSIAAQAWSMNVLAKAVGISELTFAQTTVVLGLMAIGFGMPNAPGFFGTVQLALYAGLAAYVAPEKVAHEGATFVFLFYVVYLSMILALAAIAMIVEYTLPLRDEQEPSPEGAL
jgi:hypothetical protein